MITTIDTTKGQKLHSGFALEKKQCVDLQEYSSSIRSGNICRLKLACFTSSLIRPTSAWSQKGQTSIPAIIVSNPLKQPRMFSSQLFRGGEQQSRRNYRISNQLMKNNEISCTTLDKCENDEVIKLHTSEMKETEVRCVTKPAID
jgi:hypothetical protein